MKVKRSITPAKEGVLVALAKLKYATVPQVAYWSSPERHHSRTYALLTSLIDMGLVKRHDVLQPHIFSLSREGFRVIGEPPPQGSRQESWSVLTQQCHANEAEIRLRHHYEDFEFLPNSDLYRMGLNPAIAEHGGKSDDHLIYVLVDDYNMQSERLSRVKYRSHKPKLSYFDLSKPIPNWSSIASLFICAITSETQYELHKAYLIKHKLEIALLKIEALW